MIPFLHPSPQRLDRWLVRNPSRFERYLGAHPQVADRYEQAHPLSEGARAALAAAVEVPFDLQGRLRARLAAERDTSLSAVGLDLLGLGFAALQTFVEPAPPDERTR